MEQIVTENSTVSYLPQEIMSNIILRLPVKSLTRFQCVCKYWKNLFNSPSFIAEHYHYHSTKQNSLLFDCVTAGCKLCLLNREMQVLEFQKPSFMDTSRDSWRLVCSSNGLLCFEFYHTSPSFFLWNPAIREAHQVPKALELSEDEYCCVGFGFSPMVNDYKIVRLFSSWYDHLVHRAEVYSLSKGSWKEVDVGNLEGVTDVTHYGFTCNGAIFWFGLKKGVGGQSNRCLIVSFDIAMEVFALIKMPTFSPKSSHCNEFTVYENKLAMLSTREYGNSKSSIDLWAMEGLSWTKIYTVTSCPSFLQPVAIWRDEIICKVRVGFYKTEGGLVDDNNIKTMICNLKTNEFKTCAISKCCIGNSISNYVESLVPVGNIHVEEASS